MPTYLVHGFRWSRVAIRIHIVIHDLDDAAPEWIVAPATSVTLLNSFYTLFDFLPPSNPPPPTYPLATAADKVVVEDEENAGTRTLARRKGMGSVSNLKELVRRPLSMGGGGLLGGGGKEKEVNGEGKGRVAEDSRIANGNPTTKTEKKSSFNDWSVVKLLEQHDIEDMTSTSQPYAYVADYMVEVPLGVSISDEMAKYEAKIREEESPLSSPGTPGEPSGSTGLATENGGLVSPPLSARELRRKSRRLNWFEKLRDGLEKEGEIGWFVVVCGDEIRPAPSITEDDGESFEEEQQKSPKSATTRGFWGKKKNVREERDG